MFTPPPPSFNYSPSTVSVQHWAKNNFPLIMFPLLSSVYQWAIVSQDRSILPIPDRTVCVCVCCLLSCPSIRRSSEWSISLRQLWVRSFLPPPRYFFCPLPHSPSFPSPPLSWDWPGVSLLPHPGIDLVPPPHPGIGLVPPTLGWAWFLLPWD